MRILILSSRLPWPMKRADQMTVNHLIRFLHGRGHAVHLICPIADPSEREHVLEAEKYCEWVETTLVPKWRSVVNCATGVFGSTPLQARYFESAQMQRLIDEAVAREKFDIHYAHLIRTANYLLPHSEVPKILAMQISQILNYRRMVQNARTGPKRLLYWLEYRKLCRAEPFYTRQFDRTLLISAHDRRAVEQHGRIGQVFLNPHGVDVQKFRPDPAIAREPNTIVFSAVMSTNTNVDAITYFHDAILPLVRREVPDAKLWIVGRNPVASVRRMAADPNVTVTGEVPCVGDYLARATVGIDPLRIGAGLQNKVLEAMATGLPMVATSVANEGIRGTDEQNILLADTPERFAAQVVRLLRDSQLRSRLAADARDFVIREWTWEKHFGDLEDLMLQLVAERRSTRRPSSVATRPSTAAAQLLTVSSVDT